MKCSKCNNLYKLKDMYRLESKWYICKHCKQELDIVSFYWHEKFKEVEIERNKV